MGDVSRLSIFRKTTGGGCDAFGDGLDPNTGLIVDGGYSE